MHTDYMAESVTCLNGMTLRTRTLLRQVLSMKDLVGSEVWTDVGVGLPWILYKWFL
jgi:hypothetical protein